MSAEILADRQGRRFELRSVPCPTCGTGDQVFMGYRGGEHHRYRLGVVSRIMRCSGCGLIFPNPFPFPLDPQDLYGDPEKYFEREDLHEEAATLRGNRQLVREIVSHTGQTVPSILDVGSGRGMFLHAAKLEGCLDAVGLEFSTAMVSYAHEHYGVELVLESIEEHAGQVSRTYDAIVLMAVLEHVHDPSSFLAAAARLSHPGTVVYIDVPVEPNLLTMVRSLANRLTRSRTVLNLAPTFPPYHVFGFNPRSLGALLGKHGFVIEDCRIWAHPRVPTSGGARDHMLASLGTQINRLANVTRTASNMYVWARSRDAGP